MIRHDVNAKVKIVCTIGPASGSYDTLRDMVDAGMNVARLNFSHGDYNSHGEMLKLIRKVEHDTDVPLPVLLDTKGPEIRTGELEGGGVTIENGKLLTFTQDIIIGTAERVFVNYPALPDEVKPGQFIYIDDGTLQVQVKEIAGRDVVCKVVVGGRLGGRKGINLPGADISLPALSQKDVEDIRWGMDMGMEFVAVSFVKTRSDVLEVRRLIDEAGSGMKIIAKIETRQALENIDDITDVVYGVMVARGDLGVEIPTENVPLAQKHIIEVCRAKGRVVIVATQMLDSMIRNPRPTRAEASDVANAVFDGADAVMLSGETAGGMYPVAAVSTMRRIVGRAESELPRWCAQNPIKTDFDGVPDAVSGAAVLVAQEVGASAIISLTKSGSSARMTSKHRPLCRILGVTPSVSTWRELALWWGVQPFRLPETSSYNMLTVDTVTACLRYGLIDEGDIVVLTGGVPFGMPGTTNMLEVHSAGVLVCSGFSLVHASAVGKVRVARSAEEALEAAEHDCVLVVRSLDKGYLPAIQRAGAVITESQKVNTVGALAAMERGIPCIVGVPDALNTLAEYDEVTVDGIRGLVYRGNIRLIV